MPRTSGATERGDKGWLLAFVLGLACLVISAAFVWGASSVTGVIALLSAVIAIANGLLSGPVQSSPTRTTWFPTALARLLQVSIVVRPAAMAAWILTAAFCGYAVQQALRKTHTATVTGLVITANGTPADRALVTLILGQSKRTAVAANGKFAFEDVYTGDAPGSHLFVEATLENTVAKTVVDLAHGKDVSVVMRLSAYDKRVRVAYYTIDGHGLDFVARGELDARWEHTLSGQPYIVENDTFKYLKYLMVNFSETFQDTSFYVGPKYTPYEDVAQRNQGRLFFSPAWNRTLPRQISVGDTQSLRDPRSQWNLEFADVKLDGTPSKLVPDQPLTVGNQAVRVDPEAFFYWRFTTAGDFKTLGSTPSERFYTFITRDYLPDDFFVVMLKCDIECADPASYPSMHETIIPREVELLVAVVENISNQPIQIGGARVRNQSSVQRLRDETTESGLLQTEPEKEASLFPPEVLAPGEKLLIPLQLRSVYHESDLPAFRRSRQRPRGDVEADLLGIDAVYLPAYSASGPELFAIDHSTFLAYVDKPSLRAAFTKDYIFGPSYQLASIEVDGANVPFRQYDPTNLVIQSGSPMGSCPYIFTYSGTDHTWASEGTILFGFNRREREATDNLRMHRFDGRILIREVDAEVSFIDSVHVIEECADGSTHLLYPENRSLRKDDKDYLMLKRGEERSVAFGLPQAGLCQGSIPLSQEASTCLNNEHYWPRPHQFGRGG
jgi:hypothetical protein